MEDVYAYNGSILYKKQCLKLKKELYKKKCNICHVCKPSSFQFFFDIEKRLFGTTLCIKHSFLNTNMTNNTILLQIYDEIYTYIFDLEELLLLSQEEKVYEFNTILKIMRSENSVANFFS